VGEASATSGTLPKACKSPTKRCNLIPLDPFSLYTQFRLPFRLSNPLSRWFVSFCQRRYGLRRAGIVLAIGQGVSWTLGYHAYNQAINREAVWTDVFPYPVGYHSFGLGPFVAVALAELLRIADAINALITRQTFPTFPSLPVGPSATPNLSALLEEAWQLYLMPVRTPQETARLAQISYQIGLGEFPNVNRVPVLTPARLAEEAAQVTSISVEEARRVVAAALNAYPPNRTNQLGEMANRMSLDPVLRQELQQALAAFERNQTLLPRAPTRNLYQVRNPVPPYVAPLNPPTERLIADVMHRLRLLEIEAEILNAAPGGPGFGQASGSGLPAGAAPIAIASVAEAPTGEALLVQRAIAGDQAAIAEINRLALQEIATNNAAQVALRAARVAQNQAEAERATRVLQSSRFKWLVFWRVAWGASLAGAGGAWQIVRLSGKVLLSTVVRTLNFVSPAINTTAGPLEAISYIPIISQHVQTSQQIASLPSAQQQTLARAVYANRLSQQLNTEARAWQWLLTGGSQPGLPPSYFQALAQQEGTPPPYVRPYLAPVAIDPQSLPPPPPVPAPPQTLPVGDLQLPRPVSAFVPTAPPPQLLTRGVTPPSFSSWAGLGLSPTQPETVLPTIFPTLQLPSLEESLMSFFKGTIDFNSIQGGWSESVYSSAQGETQSTMMQKMIGLLNYRMRLSYGPDWTQVGCTNPVLPFQLRVEDELYLRDSSIVDVLPPGSSPAGNQIVTPASYQTSGVQGSAFANQNIDLELGTRIKFQSGTPLQYAYPMFHGVPLGGLNPGPGANFPATFLRFAGFTGQYQANLWNMIAYMATTGLGYRNITGAWNSPNNVPGPYSTPDTWYYDNTKQQIWLCWINVGASPNPPFYPTGLAYPIQFQAYPTWPNKGALCRLQVRKWKSFPLLVGRWSAQVVYYSATVPSAAPLPVGYQFILKILRQVRQPQINTADTPAVSPIAWTPWYPSQSLLAGYAIQQGPNPVIPTGIFPLIQQLNQIQYVESKKLGRPFGGGRGRQRNRPQ
jgi:hypothetical protein